MLSTALLTLHIIVALLLITLVLVQRGNSRVMEAGGASQTVFGSQGSKSFITRLTGVITGLLFMTSIGLHWLNPKGAVDEFALLSNSRPSISSIIASK